LRVHIVFVDADKRLCIGRSGTTEFHLLKMSAPKTVRNGDTLVASAAAGGATLDAFNESRGSLLQMRMVKKFARFDDAIRAAKEHAQTPGRLGQLLKGARFR